MSFLKTRIKRLEKKAILDVRQDGIPKWAFDYAMQRAKSETANHAILVKMTEAIERECGDKQEIPSKRFITHKDIEDFARELSSKYGSLEDYKNRKVVPSKETIAVMENATKKVRK